MKKLIILIFLASSVIHAQQVNFRDGTVSEILQLAKKENKPVFYMFYATWCPHCTKMKEEVMTNLTVAEYFNKNFVSAKQDMEVGAGAEMRKQFAIKSYPTFIFFDTNGDVIYRLNGEFKSDELVAEAKNALDPSKQFTTLKREFLADVSNSDKALSYILALRKGGADANANEVARKYLATQNDKQLVSAMNWRILANGLRDIDSREFQFVLKNQKDFAAVASPTRVEKKIVNVVYESLAPYAEASDTITYYRNRPFAAAIQLANTDSLVYNYDLRILENTKNWKRYTQTASQGAPKYSWKDAAQLKEIAKIYMNNVDDASALKDAVAMAERSLAIKDSYDIYIILARLNLKAGDKVAAKSWAQKGKQIAITYQWDTKQADEVLNQIK